MTSVGTQPFCRQKASLTKMIEASRSAMTTDSPAASRAAACSVMRSDDRDFSLISSTTSSSRCWSSPSTRRVCAMVIERTSSSRRSRTGPVRGPNRSLARGQNSEDLLLSPSTGSKSDSGGRREARPVDAEGLAKQAIGPEHGEVEFRARRPAGTLEMMISACLRRRSSPEGFHRPAPPSH